MSIEESLTRHAMALERMADVLEELIRAKLSVEADKLMPAKPKTDRPGPGRPRKKIEPAPLIRDNKIAGTSTISHVLNDDVKLENNTLSDVRIPSGNWRGDIGYPQVKAATYQVKDTKGIAAVMEILAGFGVKSATELKPEQWIDYIAACKAASSPALDPIA